MALDSQFRLTKKLTFLQHASGPSDELSEGPETLPESPATRTPLNLEVPSLGLPTIVREAEKSELLGFPSPTGRGSSSKAPELDASSLLFSDLQPKLVEPCGKLPDEGLGIVSVLEACEKVVGYCSGKCDRIQSGVIVDFSPTA